MEFQEAKLGASFAREAGAGTISIALDAVHRSLSSPSLLNVSTFGSTASLTSGGTQDETFGQIAIEFTTPLGQSDLLTLAASSNVGSRSQSLSLSAEYAWEF